MNYRSKESEKKEEEEKKRDKGTGEERKEEIMGMRGRKVERGKKMWSRELTDLWSSSSFCPYDPSLFIFLNS